MPTTAAAIDATTARTPPPPPPCGPCRAHAFRLKPGDSVRSSLTDAVRAILSRGVGEDDHDDDEGARRRRRSSSAFVLTAVGSVTDVTLRLASASAKDGSANAVRRWPPERRFEVVSLVGTFAKDDARFHLHASLSDEEGNTVGGHLVDAVVFTTLEVVVGTADRVEFAREFDDDTGYAELVVRRTSDDHDDDHDDQPSQTPRAVVSTSAAATATVCAAAVAVAAWKTFSVVAGKRR